MKKNKRRYRINKAKLTFLIVAFITIVMTGGNMVVNAADRSQQEPTRIYKSVRIEKGDTLWDIANEYVTEDMTVNEYLNEIADINNLTSSKIITGRYIIVFYYE